MNKYTYVTTYFLVGILTLSAQFLMAQDLKVEINSVQTEMNSSQSYKPETSNEKAFTPELILPTGVDSNLSTNPYTGEVGPARKGIIASTLNNIALLNTLLRKGDVFKHQIKIEVIIAAIVPILPSLRVVGIFDLFTPTS